MTTRADSHASLPAVRVFDACASTLDGVARARAELMTKLIDAKWPRYSLRRGIKMLTGRRTPWDILFPEEHEIARLHRSEEERAVTQLRDLARAVADDDPLFRVEVTGEDFAYIKESYFRERS